MATSLWHSEHQNSLNDTARIADKGLIPIEKIEFNPDERLHKLQPETVARIVESAKITGQITPIVVYRKQRVGGGYGLIAGHHRIMAAKELGQTEINASVLPYMDADDAALAEIDDNLVRGELDKAELSDHIAKRVALHNVKHAAALAAQAHEDARQRGLAAAEARKTEEKQQPVEQLGIPSALEVKPRVLTGAQQTAKDTGIEYTKITEAVKAANTLPLERVAHTSLAREEELRAGVRLAKEKPELVEREIVKAEAGDKTASFKRVEAEIEKTKLNPKTERLLVTLLYHMKNSETDAGRQIVFDRVREVFKHPEGNPYDVAQRKAHDQIRGLAKGLK